MCIATAALCAFASLGRAQSGPPQATPTLGQDLGRYEREALEEALAIRKLQIDPSPEGKSLGKIHVVNLEVFSTHDGLFQLANVFHTTTKEDIIEREGAPSARHAVALGQGDRDAQKPARSGVHDGGRHGSGSIQRARDRRSSGRDSGCMEPSVQLQLPSFKTACFPLCAFRSRRTTCSAGARRPRSHSTWTLASF